MSTMNEDYLVVSFLQNCICRVAEYIIKSNSDNEPIIRLKLFSAKYDLEDHIKAKNSRVQLLRSILYKKFERIQTFMENKLETPVTIPNSLLQSILNFASVGIAYDKLTGLEDQSLVGCFKYISTKKGDFVRDYFVLNFMDELPEMPAEESEEELEEESDKELEDESEEELEKKVISEPFNVDVELVNEPSQKKPRAPRRSREDVKSERLSKVIRFLEDKHKRLNKLTSQRDTKQGIIDKTKKELEKTKAPGKTKTLTERLNHHTPLLIKINEEISKTKGAIAGYEAEKEKLEASLSSKKQRVE